MNTFDILILLAVFALVAFQAWLTHRVFKSRMYERKQKIWQAQLIWLLPIIGAGLVFTILQEDARAEREASAAQKLLKAENSPNPPTIAPKKRVRSRG